MWPFSKKKNKAPKRGGGDITKVGSRMLRVSSLEFFGSYHESPNGRYLIGWSDSNREKGIGGFREDGEGQFILAKDEEIIFSGKLQRPNDGKISSVGTFVINDWVFGAGLKGILYVFDKTGKELLSHLFNANLINSGISEDGLYAVCQCANSDTSDGGMLSIFEVESGNRLCTLDPYTGWADSYEFDTKNEWIYLKYNENEKYRYNFSGEFLDEEKWKLDRVEYGSIYELIDIAESDFKSLDSVTHESTNSILSLLESVMKKNDVDNYPEEKAKAFRLLGEISEGLGKYEDAIGNYKLALKFNPKVGVKRKLQKLKKVKA